MKWRKVLVITTTIGLGMTGCWRQNGENDEGLSTDAVDVGDGVKPFDPTDFRVEGRVVIGRLGATDVHVTARCGDKTFDTITDEEGGFELTTNVEGCTPLVVELDKESYLPSFRVIPMPMETSGIFLQMPIEELEELQCGTLKCTTNKTQMNSDPVMQGWLIHLAGLEALDFIPGEMRDDTDHLTSFLGFSYFDFEDAAGAELTSFTPEPLCFIIDKEALDWIGDIDLSTDQVEMGVFRLDEATGHWRKRPDPAVIHYVLGDKYERDENGDCVYLKDADGERMTNFVALGRDQLGDARAETLYVENPCTSADPPDKRHITSFAACLPVDGSGWYAWGVAVPHKTCYAFEVKDECGNPLPNVIITAKGRDHGHRAETWTNLEGKACIEVLPSEPVGEDYDGDGLGGEIFWTDLTLNWQSGTKVGITDHENMVYPNGQEGCAAPEQCTRITQQYDVPGGCE